MNPIEEIISRLKRYPEADAVVSDDSVTINPSNENGFPVCFQLNGDEFQVGFDGWHEHFDDAEEALNCFVFGLSTACRLKVTLSGKRPSKWTVQSQEEGIWVDDSTVGMFLVPFWRAKTIVYRQNSLIEG